MKKIQKTLTSDYVGIKRTLYDSFKQSIDIMNADAEAQIRRRSSLFRGLSKMSRYRRANISRKVGRRDVDRGGWFRSAAANRLAQVCLIYRREYKFCRKVDDALRGETRTHTAIRHLLLSIVCCELDPRLTLTDCRSFILSAMSHTRRKTWLCEKKLI